MDWSLLLPQTLNPVSSLRVLIDGEQSAAAQALSDFFIFVVLLIAVIFLLVSIVVTFKSLTRSGKYLRALSKGDPKTSVLSSDLPYFREFSAHLIQISSGDPASLTRRRTVDAAEVFRESYFAPGFTSNRLFLAIPGILVGLGVLGTFVGLQMGLASLQLADIEILERSIIPLIEGCAVAFSTSVWGVLTSLVFGFLEKIMEGIALTRVRILQNKLDSLFPRFVPEESIVDLEKSSRSTKETMDGLAVAIGEHMQQAIARLGQEIKEAVASATKEGQAPLLELSAEMLAKAITGELEKLKNEIGAMGEKFASQFNSTSQDMVQCMEKLRPIVDGLDRNVEGSNKIVTAAVESLNGHVESMDRLREATVNIQAAADSFRKTEEALLLSAERNEKAAVAQENAAELNVQVVTRFDSIREGLDAIKLTVGAASSVISDFGPELAQLKELIQKQPQELLELEASRNSLEEDRSRKLFQASKELAEKVEAAAERFTQIEKFAKELTAATQNLEGASGKIEGFGNYIHRASEEYREALDSSQKAAEANERVATALTPIPQKIDSLADGLGSSGDKIRSSAEAARDTYMELHKVQEMWFAGVNAGLSAIRDQLQVILSDYGEKVEGQTRNLMKLWTDEVNETLKTYQNQSQEITDKIEELAQEIEKLRNE
jgi:gas vesicle protein